MKKSLLIGFLVTISVQLYAQTAKIKQAETYFKTFRFAEATPIYQELIQKDNILLIDNEQVFYNAITSAEKCRNYTFENDVLARISLSEKYTFDYAFMYFQLNVFLGFYDKAKEILNSAIVEASSDPRKEILKQYKGGAVWDELKSDTSKYILTKSEFNSGKGDFNPIYHPKGIAFTSARDIAARKSTFDNSSYLNLYVSSKVDGKVEELKFLETARHDGTSCYDSINQLWYYSKNFPSTKQISLTTTGLFIFDEKTKVEVPFAFNDGQFFLAQPSLSSDGQTLWFSSNRTGGFGKADIWYSTKTDQGWSTPINAGDVINTSENEMFPYFHTNKLYFSSNGHPGLGGLDLFSVTFNATKSNQLENLGANLNSNGDDFALILDQSGKKGYFSTNRADFIDNIYGVTITTLDFIFIGTIVADVSVDKLMEIPVLVKKEGIVIDTIYPDKNGKFDFKGDKNSSYTFEINEMEFIPVTESYSTVGKTQSDTTLRTFDLSPKFIDVVTTVLDEKTNLPLADTKVDIKNLTTGEIISVLTDKDGVVKTKLLRNNEFEVVSTHKDYLDKTTSLSTVSKEKEMISKISLKKVELNALLSVKNLLYDYDKAILKKESIFELDKVVVFLKENPKVSIELISHTDCRGLDEYNMVLSKKRSVSAVSYILSKGISKERVQAKWFGETVLLNRCDDNVECTEEEHKLNRRTEFKVVGL